MSAKASRGDLLEDAGTAKKTQKHTVFVYDKTVIFRGKLKATALDPLKSTHPRSGVLGPSPRPVRSWTGGLPTRPLAVLEAAFTSHLLGLMVPNTSCIFTYSKAPGPSPQVKVVFDPGTHPNHRTETESPRAIHWGGFFGVNGAANGVWGLS